MKFFYFFVALTLINLQSYSQNLSYNDLREIMNYKDFQIDTFLVKREYKALPKEQEEDTYYFRWTYRYDTVGVVKYNYVSVIDVYSKKAKTRLFRYGTLDPIEMVDIVEALKEDGYVYKDKFDYGEQIHVTYFKGDNKVIMKYITINNKKELNTVFEFEFGS